MASSVVFKLAIAVVVCMVVAAPLTEAAISCSTVVSKLGPCTSYLKGGPGPSAACCAGVKSLVSAASTPADRKTACGCLKSASGSIPGLNLSNAQALPGKCKVNVPYPISPSVDCSKVK